MNLATLKEVLGSSYVGAMVFFRDSENEDYRLDFMSKAVNQYLPKVKIKNDTSLKNLLDLIVPESMRENIYNGILNSGQSFSKEFEVRSVLGESNWFEIRSSHIHLKNKTRHYLLILLTSVTEEKEQEFQLKYQKDEIERAAKMASLGEMAAGISHELNTPLNTIQSYVDMINGAKGIEDIDQYKKLVSQASEQIEKTVEYITEVIAGLRLLSKFKKDEIKSEVNIRELVESVVSILEIKIRHRGVQFYLDFQDKGWPNVNGFATQITQVLVNLVNNAVDAISEEPEKWIKMELGQDGKECFLRIIDSGQGVDPALEAKIMTPFFTTKDAGTGLGLSLSKSIVLNHGGSLSVNKTFPNTCFEVRLPTI